MKLLFVLLLINLGFTLEYEPCEAYPASTIFQDSHQQQISLTVLNQTMFVSVSGTSTEDLHILKQNGQQFNKFFSFPSRRSGWSGKFSPDGTVLAIFKVNGTNVQIYELTSLTVKLIGKINQSAYQIEFNEKNTLFIASYDFRSSPSGYIQVYTKKNNIYSLQQSLPEWIACEDFTVSDSYIYTYSLNSLHSYGLVDGTYITLDTWKIWETFLDFSASGDFLFMNTNYEYPPQRRTSYTEIFLQKDGNLTRIDSIQCPENNYVIGGVASSSHQDRANLMVTMLGYTKVYRQNGTKFNQVQQINHNQRDYPTQTSIASIDPQQATPYISIYASNKLTIYCPKSSLNIRKQ